MDVRHRSLGGREQVEFAQRGLIQPLAHRVSLVLELRKLPHAHHAVAADDVRRRNLRVAVLRRVEFEEELNQRPLQPRAPVRVEQEAAAGELRAAREVHELERLAQLDVGLGLERELRLRAPVLHLRVVGGGSAQRHAGVRRVRQADENGIARGLGLGGGLVECSNLVTERAGLALLGLGLGELLLAHERADFLGDLVAERLQVLDLLERCAPLLVELEHLVNLHVVRPATGRETLLHQLWLFPNPFDVNHAGGCKEAAREGQGGSGAEALKS